ncbi:MULTISPECIES: hypothetical protein [unclassified Moorena]|nr:MULTISPECIES: hypothetical protein [unclassified Moorena]
MLWRRESGIGNRESGIGNQNSVGRGAGARSYNYRSLDNEYNKN